MANTPRPTRQNPANWETVAAVREGHVIVTDHTGNTAEIISKTPVGKGRFAVSVAGQVRPFFPCATASTPVLVLR